MNPDIYKIELIGSGSLSVMAKPVSGEWIEDEFSDIANWGIDRIVSLLELKESFEVGLGKEKQLTEKYEMEFIHYPIPDRGLPKVGLIFAVFSPKINDCCFGVYNFFKGECLRLIFIPILRR